MHAHARLLVLFAALLLSCEKAGKAEHPDAGASGAGPSTDTAGGAFSADGGATDGNGGATDGNGGSSMGGSSMGSTFTVSGTVSIPQGSIGGTQIVACVLVNGDCEPGLSQVLEVTSAGSSAPFSFSTLQTGSAYYLVAAKDVDGNDDLNPGDYLVVALDADGNALEFKQGTSALTLTMAEVLPPQDSTPASLVGSWKSERIGINDGSLGEYIIGADATYSYFFFYDWRATCLLVSEWTINKKGTLAVSGDQITFSPSSSTSEEVNCFGTKKQKPGSTLPNTFTYRIGPSSDGSGGVALYLTSSSDGGETEYRKE